jgi:hypothetical protein
MIQSDFAAVRPAARSAMAAACLMFGRAQTCND